MGILTKGNNLKNVKVVNNQAHKCDDIAFVTIMVVSVKGSTCWCLSIDKENNKTCRRHCGPFSKNMDYSPETISSTQLHVLVYLA